MQRHGLLEILRLQGCVPNRIHRHLIVHFFENSIAADHNVVIVLFDLEGTDFWDGDYDVGVASIARIFGLDIADCARD